MKKQKNRKGPQKTLKSTLCQDQYRNYLKISDNLTFIMESQA